MRMTFFCRHPLSMRPVGSGFSFELLLEFINSDCRSPRPLEDDGDQKRFDTRNRDSCLELTLPIFTNATPMSKKLTRASVSDRMEKLKNIKFVLIARYFRLIQSRIPDFVHVSIYLMRILVTSQMIQYNNQLENALEHIYLKQAYRHGVTWDRLEQHLSLER